jgi:ATP-binding protein involved in chromosome partitioning
MTPQQKKVVDKMQDIEHKIAFFSGKGGDGKSFVTANVAAVLAEKEGTQISVFDSDFHGPTIPKMLGVDDRGFEIVGDTIKLPESALGVKVASIAFLLRSSTDAVIWRGPIKMGAMEQLLANVDWSGTEYLLFDLPPGTGDEALNVVQLIPKLDGFVSVTIPTEVSGGSVSKSVTFARKVKARVLGVIENMSGFECPKCGERVDIFAGNAGEEISDAMDVPLLGKIPLDPRVAEASDLGVPVISKYPDAPVSKAIRRVSEKILDQL